MRQPYSSGSIRQSPGPSSDRCSRETEPSRFASDTPSSSGPRWRRWTASRSSRKGASRPGSLLALWMTGTALNVSSLVGMIMVVGIVAKNGILLLDFAEREYAQTNDLETALVRAGRVRLRPILMTSIAAGAGLAPLAVGLGAGAQTQQPLAIAILGGLSISMLFSLVGVPVLHVVLSRGRRK